MSDPNIYRPATLAPELFRRAVPQSARPLSDVGESLFIHASNAKVASVARFCATDLVGAVYTMPVGQSRNATLAKTLRRHYDIAGGEATVFADANEYTGKDRKFAIEGLDAEWINLQHEAGLEWALTNSGYVAKDDFAGLESLFHEADRIAKLARKRFVLVLPVDFTWLAYHADRVRDLVEQYGIPVAYMLGAAGDPFASQKAVQGLAHVLQSAVPSSLLRSDQSAIGALALGASLAAIGTNSTMRHIYPPSDGFGRPTQISAMVPQGLSMHHIDMLALAVSLSPEQLHWQCSCDACQGRRLDMILDEDHAFRHTIYSSIDVARHVLAGATIDENKKSWLATCRNAQFVHIDVATSTGMKWEAPSFLGAWVALDGL